jgi:hypothetical protein
VKVHHHRRRGRGRLVAFAAALSLISPAAASSADLAEDGGRPLALRLERGSVAHDQVVALGRDLRVAGEALADVVAVDGSVAVSGRVEGDVIVLGGDVELAPGAHLGGDVFVLGGEVSTAPGVTVVGRTVAYPSVSRAWLTLLEGPTLGLPASSPLVLGAKLALLCGWLALVLLLFATSGREVLATSESVAGEPIHNFLVGLTAVLALVLTALFLTALAAGLVAVPLLFLVGLVAMLLKLWGMVAVFHALGDWIAPRLRALLPGRRRRHVERLLPLTAATLGLLLLGAVKLLPWVGVWAWTVATFIGVGAALSTKLGRREPWLATV